MFGEVKEVKFKDSVHDKLKEGVNTLSNAVRLTLGPKGRNVVLGRHFNPPHVTKDGVSVAREIFLEDEIENIAAQIIKQAAARTAEDAGDGTTTSTILSAEIFNRGLKAIKSDSNPIDIKRGIDKTVKQVVEQLKKQSIEIGTDYNKIKDIATISANNDEEIGILIADAIKLIGRDGKILTEVNEENPDTYIKHTSGSFIEHGWISQQFINNESEHKKEFENCLILVTDHKIDAFTQVKPYIEYAHERNRPLLIIAEELEGEALIWITTNVIAGKLKCAVVRPPSVAGMRTFALQDLAISTGATYFSKERHDLSKGNASHLGTAKKVIVDRKSTIIVEGNGDKKKIQERINSIKTTIEASPKGIKDRHKERLAKTFTGIVNMYIGANTEVEKKEKRDRIDDALCATQAAIEEGIVPGGGIAYLSAINKIKGIKYENSDEALGGKIVLDSCIEPFKQILFNAGKSPDIILGNVMNGSKYFGYNARTEEYEDDMIKAGIIDPTKVTRVALENAASAATMLLITDCVIYKKEENYNATIRT
jgi:chaperonin GroEL